MPSNGGGAGMPGVSGPPAPPCAGGTAASLSPDPSPRGRGGRKRRGVRVPHSLWEGG